MKHQVLTITTVSERSEVSTQVYLFERLDQAQANLALCYQSATSARVRDEDEVEESFILPDQTRYGIWPSRSSSPEAQSVTDPSIHEGFTDHLISWR